MKIATLCLLVMSGALIAAQANAQPAASTNVTAHVDIVDEPAADYTLHLQPIGETFAKNDIACTTDRDGNFQLANLPDGDYRLFIDEKFGTQLKLEKSRFTAGPEHRHWEVKLAWNIKVKLRLLHPDGTLLQGQACSFEFREKLAGRKGERWGGSQSLEHLAYDNATGLYGFAMKDRGTLIYLRVVASDRSIALFLAPTKIALGPERLLTIQLARPAMLELKVVETNIGPHESTPPPDAVGAGGIALGSARAGTAPDGMTNVLEPITPWPPAETEEGTGLLRLEGQAPGDYTLDFKPLACWGPSSYVVHLVAATTTSLIVYIKPRPFPALHLKLNLPDGEPAAKREFGIELGKSAPGNTHDFSGVGYWGHTDIDGNIRIGSVIPGKYNLFINDHTNDGHSFNLMSANPPEIEVAPQGSSATLTLQGK